MFNPFLRQDIRSFFSAKSKASIAPTPAAASPKPSTSAKRKTVVLDSDSDDDVRKAPKSLSSKLDKPKATKKRRIVSSDEDETKQSPQKKPTMNGGRSKQTPEKKKEYKPVDVFGALGNGAIKREQKQKKAKATEKDLFNDSIADDILLMDVDETVLDVSVNQQSSKDNGPSPGKMNGKPVKDHSSAKYDNSKPKSNSTRKERKQESPSTPQKANTDAKVKEEKATPSSQKKDDKAFKEPKREKKDDLNKSTKASGTPDRSKAGSSKKEKKPKDTEENLDYSCNSFIAMQCAL